MWKRILLIVSLISLPLALTGCPSEDDSIEDEIEEAAEEIEDEIDDAL